MVSPLTQLTRDGSWQLDLPHDRNDHLLIWVTRGQGLALLDGTRSGFSAHNALYIPARNLLTLELGRTCLGHVLVVPETNPLSMPCGPHHIRVVESSEQTALTVLFDAVQREQTGQGTLWHRAVQAYGELIGIWLRRHIHDIKTAAARPSAARRLSIAYCARVVDHFASGMSMADHAAALNVTPTHLTRVCKSETGKTAATLLTERQLHAARSLLIETDLPIRDIAGRLGFGSAAYFTRFIAQHTGRTPSALRKLSQA